MREFLAVVRIPAECEDDFKEQLDVLDAYDLDMWWELPSEETK